jgi:hypothetical protein
MNAMEDTSNKKNDLHKNGRQPQKKFNGRQPQKKMQDDLKLRKK